MELSHGVMKSLSKSVYLRVYNLQLYNYWQIKNWRGFVIKGALNNRGFILAFFGGK
jgi:hypothetical protein